MTSSPAGPRRGLVLGAGGVLGFAWAVGALTALEQARGFDARAADVLVGTSAGSVTAAMLGAGIAVEAMLRHQQGVVLDGDARVDDEADADPGGVLPPPPVPFPDAPGLLARTVFHPRRVPPMALLAGALPAGRGTLAPVGRMIDALVPAGEWAAHPATWIVAMDYQTGRRVPFGRPGSPRAGLADAVMASCSIPGWYAPVRIGDRRYVDGGACSATSLDLLAPMGLDEVVVVAPMASFTTDRPTSVAGRLERRFRGLVTKRLEREAEKVRRAGTEVTLLAPGPEDLEAIGANLMDSRRREEVLATSLRTSARALRDGGSAVRAATGAGLAPAG